MHHARYSSTSVNYLENTYEDARFGFYEEMGESHAATTTSDDLTKRPSN